MSTPKLTAFTNWTKQRKNWLSPEEEHFIDLYNSVVQEINDELEGMGIPGEKGITKPHQAKIDTINSDPDLIEAYKEMKGVKQ
tara:strand:- start:14 stop:262 length:249 start_codon:yes stop_codon:yes gene_type:complete